jgi:hypothetical protein
MSSTFNILSATTTPLTPDSASRSALKQGAAATGVTGGAVLAETSAIVELGNQPPEALTYAATLPRVQQIWTAGASDDAVSKQIATNFAATDASHRLRGLGAALLEGYKGEAGNYRQALLSFTGVPGSAAAEQAQQVADIELQVAATQKFSLSVKTQSGAMVELSIASRADGLGVELKTSQALTGNELKAVQDLADGFEAAVKGLTEVPPRIAIDALSRFDSSAIASLDLRASFSKEGGEPLSLSFSATAAGRTLSVETATGALDLSVDLANPQLRGDQAQRTKAIGNYLTQVDVAAKRGNGDKALVELFKNAFSEIHAYYPDDETTVARRPLRDYEAAALSGLADFKAGLKVTAVASNPMRPGEVDYFNYLATQESTLTTGERTKLTQLRETVLDAAFHKGLKSDKAPILTADPRSQNYRYFQVNDRMSSKVTIEHDELAPVRAEQAQSSSKFTGIQTYERGKLIKEEKLPEQHAFVLDLLETIKNLSLDPAERQRQLAALNDRVLLQG